MRTLTTFWRSFRPAYDNYRIYYLHLATHISVDSKHIVPCVDELPLIQEGQHVTGGVSVIGRVGSAGVSKNGRGKHLHFEVHILNRGTGIPVDPYGGQEAMQIHIREHLTKYCGSNHWGRCNHAILRNRDH